MDKLVELLRLQKFFEDTVVSWDGDKHSWLTHITRNANRGYRDEEQLVQPLVFPAFAREFLGFEVGLNLAAEKSSASGIPDFTPADRLTHQFVFEAKGSSDGVRQLSKPDYEEKVSRYLEDPATSDVVITNMVGILVYSKNQEGHLVKTMQINLRELTSHTLMQASLLPDADKFLVFLTRFRRMSLTTAEKIERIRRAPGWTSKSGITDPEWLRARIEHVVEILSTNVEANITSGALTDPLQLSDDQRLAVLDELRHLAVRLQIDVAQANEMSLDDFLSAPSSTSAGKALRQYEAHVAYWLTTKLVLARIWEDLGLLDPINLYDGGFDGRMAAFNNNVLDVIDFAFRKAAERYNALFTDRPTYSWFVPDPNVAVNALYELATTYFGEIRSDVLGMVYEGTLQRIDRKLLGQYYTPRDVIRLIWDLALDDKMFATAESAGRGLRVLDIAAGSGGFLVEGIARARTRLESQLQSGATISNQEWLNNAAAGFNGVELQRFSAFLAELNLLIQFSHVLQQDNSLRMPELGIVPADTLSLHGRRPGAMLADPLDPQTSLVDSHYIDASERIERARRITARVKSFETVFDSIQ